jgi:4-diphosphocytidyl-2-C-methyl-D-erythritol kinase
VGERLEAITLPEGWFVVLTPAVNISTAEVFSSPQLIRDSSPITIRDFLKGRGRNVCEPVVTARFPEVAGAIAALGQFAPASMTGTGASVFARFDDEASARQAWAALAQQWQGFVARGINQSPLLTVLQATRKCG